MDLPILLRRCNVGTGVRRYAACTRAESGTPAGSPAEGSGVVMATRSQREQRAKIIDGRLVRCQQCRAWIDLEFGRDQYVDHMGADGTQGDPRSPGEHDDICDVCQHVPRKGAE